MTSLDKDQPKKDSNQMRLSASYSFVGNVANVATASVKTKDAPPENKNKNKNDKYAVPKQFGTLTLSAQEGPARHTKYTIVATVDRSGSMGDICSDHKTKMDQIHHTLKNMVNYLKNVNENISLTLSIYGFDHSLITICENSEINEAFAKDLPNTFAALIPGGLTNIKLALDKAKEICASAQNNYKEDPETHKLIHFHLTDGHITEGEREESKLIKAVHTDHCVNAFMGFGTEHSSHLLQALGDVPGGEYHFIDSLENAGMVYGEILHSVLYEQAKNIKIEIRDGKIYDYKTNTWKTKIVVPSIAAGQTKTLHIKNNDASNTTPVKEATISITYENSGDNETVADMNIVPTRMFGISHEKMNIYWLRQLTQEFMYEGKQIINHKRNNTYDTQRAHLMLDYAKQSNWDAVWGMLMVESEQAQAALINALPVPRRYRLVHHAIQQNNEAALIMLLSKGAKLVQTSDHHSVHYIADKSNAYACKKHLQTTPDTSESFDIRVNAFLKYLKENLEQTEDDTLSKMLQQLVDDIYITIRSQTSTLGNMFLGARAITQGSERAYVACDITDLEMTQNRAGHAYRSMSAPHCVSTDTTTTFASIGAKNLMEKCSR